MPRYCAHCEHLNPDAPTCEKCGKDKVEKLYPLWRRAMAKEPDYRKYAPGKSKHKRRGR